MSGPEPNAVTEPRPWEEPGQWRRDGVPHRGRLLNGLAVAAAVCAVLGWGLCLPAPVGFGLGVLVWLMARRDLRLMEAGLMDPAGRELTETARRVGISYACLGLIPSLVLCWLHWYFLLGDRLFVIYD
jgi:hypothetical protein